MNILLNKAKSPATAKGYAGVWKLFQQWCQWADCQWLPSSEESLLGMVVWLNLMNKTSDIPRFLAAVKFEHLKAGLSDPTVSERLRLVAQGAKRRGADDRIKDELRLPFPVESLAVWFERQPENISRQRWLRDGTVVCLGIRCMRHVSELAAFRRRDIWFDKDDIMYVHVRRFKTDQFGVGKVIPVEPSGDPLICPVGVMKRYLAEFKGSPDSPLFVSLNDSSKGMSDSSISATVSKMAKILNLVGRFTGHSLRIDGVTAAMRGGLTMAQIRAIGDWESKAIRDYLRAVGTLSIGASSRMGFLLTGRPLQITHSNTV